MRFTVAAAVVSIPPLDSKNSQSYASLREPMNQPYFVLVLAHSVHGRLRRMHVSHTILYTVLALALVGGVTVAGFLSSYARMAWKVAKLNHLRDEVSTLQQKYQALSRTNEQTKEQLATLQLLASEVTSAYGIKGTPGRSGVYFR